MRTGFNVDRLRELIAERQTTPRAVARAISNEQNPYLLRDILNGKIKNPRSDTVAKIADHLGVAIEELFSQGVSETVHSVKRQVVHRLLGVRYLVQAGLWFELESQEPPEQIELYVQAHPQYADREQWLERVIGDSANLRIPDGHIIHVVDAFGYAPKDGDWVVVERRRDQGAIRERTVKQVEIKDGHTSLWPRSSNPRWSEPVDFMEGARPGEEVEAQIVGRVIGSYDPNF